MRANQSEIRRSKPAGLIMLVGLTILLTGMERTMADSAVTQRVLQVEHITMKTTKKFAEVEAALERNVPQLDPAIAAALANGDEQRATELEQGAPLFIFLKRDHGALLQVTGRPRKALQYEIGNPHTASKMPVIVCPPAFMRCCASYSTKTERVVDFRIRQTVVSFRPVWR